MTKELAYQEFNDAQNKKIDAKYAFIKHIVLASVTLLGIVLVFAKELFNHPQNAIFLKIGIIQIVCSILFLNIGLFGEVVNLTNRVNALANRYKQIREGNGLPSYEIINGKKIYTTFENIGYLFSISSLTMFCIYIWNC